jgi:hypothetical protein
MLKHVQTWLYAKLPVEKKGILLGGFKYFLFSIIYGIILPIDFHIFQRGCNHQPEMILNLEPAD